MVENTTKKNLKVFIMLMVFLDTHNRVYIKQNGVSKRKIRSGEKFVGKRENSKEYLAGSNKLEHPCFEQKSYFCCSKHKTRKGLEQPKTNCKSF